MAAGPGISGLRVLDLAGLPGIYGTKLLADLGADVVRIEPPKGDPLRDAPPHYQDVPGPGRSLTYAFYNTSKRALELDLTSADGRSTFRRLAAAADIVFETCAPGELDALGMGYRDLARESPGLIWVSITPFGLDGPRAGWKANDLVGLAAGGVLQQMGSKDGPPAQTPLTQAYHLAGVAGVSGALIALQYRSTTGLGQLVDVSMQSAVATSAEHAAATWELTGQIRTRRDLIGPQGQDVFFTCKDGWIVGNYGNRWEGLLAWAEEAGVADEEWRDPRWHDQDEREAHRDVINAFVRRLIQTQTKAEVSERAHRYRIAEQPVQDIPDLLADPQLAARGFWTALAHDDLGVELTYPGAPFKSSTGFWRMRRRAPLPGEHTTEILQELEEAAAAPVANRAVRVPTKPQSRPMEGIRIVDFCQVVTGPLATRMLADHGAEVLRVEWAAKAEGDRYIHPRVAGNGSPNVAALRYWFNTSKRSLTLNLQLPEARRLVARLVRTADVVVDNFGVDPFPQWGMSYEQLRKIRPDVIVARSSMVGRSGPKSGMVGFGHGIGALAGWNQLMGFPDEPPFGMRVAYPDSTANCHHLLIGILTALEHRRRTGQGQLIDLSQYESTVTWLGPAILDYTANGRPGGPSANRHPDFAPHGVYRSAGENRWIPFAVTQESWPAFRKVADVDGVDLSAPEFSTHASRKASEDDLDRTVLGWTVLHDPIELADRLQAAGIAAYVAADGHDLLEDPQLAHRGHFLRLEHPEAGMRIMERHPFELRGTPATIARAPLLGEHNDWALGELLGLTEEEVARAYVEGVIG